MFVRKTVTSTMSFQLAPASSRTSRTFSKAARHCFSISWLSILPSAVSVAPGISLLPRTRGPIPERKRKLPTRLACGNAPTGSGARLLSNVLLISSGTLTADYTDKHGFLKYESDSQQSTLNHQLLLSSGDRAHDEERLLAFHDRVGQGSVRRFMRNVFAAHEKSHQRTALERSMIANCAAQHRVFFFQSVEQRFRCRAPVKIDSHFVADFRQRPEVMR